MRLKSLRATQGSMRFALGLSSLASATWLAASNGVNDDKTTVTDAQQQSARMVPKKPPRRPHVDRYTLLATSASVNQESEPSSNNDGQVQGVAPDQVKTTEYDFVILGNGNAGLSAVITLREKCPSAKIALVDPLRPVTSTTKKLDYWPHFATGCDPVSRKVQLSNPSHILRYRHGILIATGSRGAPPPPSLLDEETLDRILELRPTRRENQKRPVMPPKAVRQVSLLAASQGATVGIMGSGWEAVELAVAAARLGPKAPMLTFGSAGPLSHILPRYLSTAVTKRLRQQGVDIQPRSLVRYVATDHQGKSAPRLEVHTAKSYDMLDTKRTSIDLLVVAPYVDGPRGTAILPTSNAPEQLKSYVSAHPWFQSWSQLTSAPMDPSIVVCFDDDGRIMVNAELQAASHVYAAGSVAKYPNSVTGHAHVAGEGSEDGARAGRMTALHMAQNYERGRNLFSGDDTPAPMSFAAESFSLSRSDMCTYLHGDSAKTNFLSDVGISALCVGQCDSELMSTHGFWWTNQSAQRLELDQGLSSTRRRTTRRRTRVSSQKSPVYGIGVVYYLDRRGRIRGIMTWGLPFVSGRKESQALNEALVSRMKEVIRTNGGISQWEAEEDAFLHSYHLSAESKKLVGLSLYKGLSRRNTSGNIQRLMVPVENMGKPLHRYTAAKPSSITGLQALKRKDNTLGDAPGENLYVKDEDEEFDSLRPPTLMYVYPMQNSKQSSVATRASPFHQNYHERTQRALRENEQRSRPSKEEPLWLRRGDAQRNTSQADLLADIFLRNISKGKFADGSDALKQAPVPKSVQDAKHTISQWMNSDDNTDDVPVEDSNPED